MNGDLSVRRSRSQPEREGVPFRNADGHGAARLPAPAGTRRRSAPKLMSLWIN